MQTLSADQLDERCAITAFFGIQALRAAQHREDTPFWKPLTRLRQRWTMATLAVAARQIEAGEHRQDQSRFVGLTEVTNLTPYKDADHPGPKPR